MGRRSSRHAKLAARVAQNNKKVKDTSGRDTFFADNRKKAETQRILDKYGAR